MSNGSNNSSVGSAIGSVFAGLLQMRLLNDQEFVKSTGRMFVSQMRISINLMRYNIKNSAERHGSASPYNRDLIFEGQRVTPEARDYLLKKIDEAKEYSELNQFTARLAWWILEKDPYVNQGEVSPPLPAAAINPRPRARLAFHIGFVIAIGISVLSAITYTMWTLPVMGVVLGLTYLRSRPVVAEPTEPEWAWLEQFSLRRSDELTRHT